MGEDTGISWCHHTYNPWDGCTKVSEGCKFCYAERDTLRWNLQVFGPKAERRQRAEAYWRNLPKWNKAALEANERRRVFLMSFGDFWEDRDVLQPPRARTLGLIEQCGALDFLILSKRPENAARLLDAAGFGHWTRDGWPANVWAMVSAENDARLVERATVLETIPAKVRGLSCEPLLGQLDSLGVILGRGLIHWAIVGGESGSSARPMHPKWARRIRRDCAAHGVAFWWKQWGKWYPVTDGGHHMILKPDGTQVPKFHQLELDDEGMRSAGYVEGKLDGQVIRELPRTRLLAVA